MLSEKKEKCLHFWSHRLHCSWVIDQGGLWERTDSTERVPCSYRVLKKWVILTVMMPSSLLLTTLRRSETSAYKKKESLCFKTTLLCGKINMLCSLKFTHLTCKSSLIVYIWLWSYRTTLVDFTTTLFTGKRVDQYMCWYMLVNILFETSSKSFFKCPPSKKNCLASPCKDSTYFTWTNC